MLRIQVSTHLPRTGIMASILNQVAMTEPARVSTGAARTPAPRIYYLNPLAAGSLRQWPALLDAVAGLGFSHVMTAPIFAGDALFLPADFDRPHPALEWSGDAGSALRFIVEACQARNLSLLLDVVPSRISAHSAVAAARPDLFRLPDPQSALDPRRYDPDGDIAHARTDAAGAFAEWWTERLSMWRDLGVGGFRLLALQDLRPATLHAVVGNVRATGDCLFLGWTPGLSREVVGGLQTAGLDFVFSSLPWWDFRAEWPWTELEVLHHVAPAIACVEAPFGPRLAAAIADTSLLGAACRRALWFAAATGDGWLLPMGFEKAATQPMDPRREQPGPEKIGPDSAADELDLSADIRAANAVQLPPGPPLVLSGPAAPVIGILRAGTDPRRAAVGSLVLANADLDRSRTVDAAALLTSSGFAAAIAEPLAVLAPGEVRVAQLEAAKPITLPQQPISRSADAAAAAPRIGIERVEPCVDQGRFAAKRTVGDLVVVEADIICDGHDQLAARLLWRSADEADCNEVRMRPLGNDRWRGEFRLSRVGRYLFNVEAWRDAFATFRDELFKKHAAGVDVRLEVIEGRNLVEQTAERAGQAAGQDALPRQLRKLSQRLQDTDDVGRISTLLSSDTAELMSRADPRPFAVRLDQPCPIDSDRAAASFGSWYEIFPRSMSDDPHRHGTFADVVRHLPRIRDMGFDVLYFPPIHPIGRKNRKGRNNSLQPAPHDPGSPYAIGSDEGGYDAVHPALGTLEEFRALCDAAAEHGLELALDFAIQCSPDHPWLREHHDWFAWRPDGSIRYAENPPKKYEDIVNVDFYANGAIPGLWQALCEVVLFWAKQGVRIFRVDNPHTKPFPFWEWLIAEVRAQYPDAIFLAEAFTRPKVMARLGKIGFTQSYTYFTWRNTKRELQEYLTELTTTDLREFFRPNFFVNTPDINPPFLQTSGRPGYLIRATLAATLSALWGVYSGFELCEGTPIPGREEYLDSEKYQIRAWDWNRPGNIVSDIATLNHIRRRNPALHSQLGLTFLACDNDQVMLYEKATPDRSNVVLVAVSLDPFHSQTASFELPLWNWKLSDDATLAAEDLLHDRAFSWHGKWQRVTLDPASPCAIWRASPAA